MPNLKDSPLKSIISQNSIVTNVANCKATNAYAFYECLYKFDLNPDVGYCVSSTDIATLAPGLSKQKKFELTNILYFL